MEGSFREGLMHLHNTPVLSACYALGTVQVFTGKATLTWACESEEAENGVCSTVQNPQKHEDACREWFPWRGRAQPPGMGGWMGGQEP